MRSNRKLRKRNAIAYLLFAIVGVQIAIYVVWKRSTDEPPQTDSHDAVSHHQPLSKVAEAKQNSALLTTHNPPPSPATADASHPLASDTLAPNRFVFDAGHRQSEDTIVHTNKRYTKDRPKPGKTGRLTLITSPSGVLVRIDGVLAGKTPLNRVPLQIGQHTITFVHVGYKNLSRQTEILASKTTKMSETLDKIELPGFSPSPKLTVVKRLPRTPRVGSSQSGSLSKGKTILASGCNSCHRKIGGAMVGPMQRTGSQWDRFFSRGSHDRYQRIGSDMSSGQLAHVKSYLMSKAADSEKDQGAGIR